MLEILIAIIIIIIALCLIVIGLSKHRIILVYLLIGAVLLGPRIPLGKVSQLQRLDLRFDDLIIFIMFISWIFLFANDRKSISYPQHMRFLFISIIVSFLVTIVGCVVNQFPLIPSLIYWAKDFEYMSLSITLPYFIIRTDSIKTLASITRVISVGMILNIAWLVWQMFSGYKSVLLSFVDVPSYGYALIGESQPFQAAAIYAVSSILFLTIFTYYKKSYLILLLLIGSFAGLLATLSRSYVFGMVAALMTLIFINAVSRNNYSFRKAILLSVLYCVLVWAGIEFLIYLDTIGLPVFRFGGDLMTRSIDDVRSELIWKPLIKYIQASPLIGYGKGSIGWLIGTFDEAHNYFLRMLVETGFLGTTPYILFLFSLASGTVALYRSNLSKEFLLVTLNMLVILVISLVVSLVQDALYSSKIAIPFYIYVGLVNHVYSLSKKVS